MYKAERNSDRYCPVWLVRLDNSEAFWSLARRVDAGLASALNRGDVTQPAAKRARINIWN